MAPDGSYESPKRTTVWLALGFAVLLALGVFTVLMPELQHDPDEESATSQSKDSISEDDEKAPQE